MKECEVVEEVKECKVAEEEVEEGEEEVAEEEVDEDKEGKEGGLPHAWLYRDWVVDAFNQDVPYDRFVKEEFDEH